MVVISFIGRRNDVTRVVGPFLSFADADNFLEKLGWTVRGLGRPNVRVNFGMGATEISAYIKEVESPK